MQWWLWLAVGLALIVAELVTPSGFFIIFFGLGALAVGVLAAVGVVTTLWLQGLLFIALTVLTYWRRHAFLLRLVCRSAHCFTTGFW